MKEKIGGNPWRIIRLAVTVLICGMAGYFGTLRVLENQKAGNYGAMLLYGILSVAIIASFAWDYLKEDE